MLAGMTTARPGPNVAFHLTLALAMRGGVDQSCPGSVFWKGVVKWLMALCVYTLGAPTEECSAGVCCCVVELHGEVALTLGAGGSQKVGRNRQPDCHGQAARKLTSKREQIKRRNVWRCAWLWPMPPV